MVSELLLRALAVFAAGVEAFTDVFWERCGLALEANPACVCVCVCLGALGCGGPVAVAGDGDQKEQSLLSLFSFFLFCLQLLQMRLLAVVFERGRLILYEVLQ